MQGGSAPRILSIDDYFLIERDDKTDGSDVRIFYNLLLSTLYTISLILKFSNFFFSRKWSIDMKNLWNLNMSVI